MGKDPMQQAKDLNEGAPVPSFQKVGTVTVQKGAIIPSMQPVKPSTPSTQQSGSQNSQSDGNTGKEKE